jgi:hypothetical protein
MPVPTGRTQRRVEKELVVELAHPDAPEPQEMATAQNISERGMRVLTEHVWHPGDIVVLSSPRTRYRTQARVVYCQRLENMGFAVGLQLSTAIEGLARPH